MTDAELEELEGPWLLMKRGLYYRPNGNGYTGAKIMAGRYDKAEVDMARDVATPVLESKASLVSPSACPMAVASEYETLIRSLREEKATRDRVVEAARATKADLLARANMAEADHVELGVGVWSELVDSLAALEEQS